MSKIYRIAFEAVEGPVTSTIACQPRTQGGRVICGVHTSLQSPNCLVLSLPFIALGDDGRNAAASSAMTVHRHVVVSVGRGFESK